MATIINNPPSNTATNDSGDGMGTGIILGIVAAVLLGVVVFFAYMWPTVQGSQQANVTNINVQVPANNQASTNQTQLPSTSTNTNTGGTTTLPGY